MSKTKLNEYDVKVLETIRSLGENWIPNGDPITDIAVDNAYKFLECYYGTFVTKFHDNPHIFPTVDSGVIIEFDENDINKEINIEIHKNGDYSYTIYEKGDCFENSYEILEEKYEVKNVHEIIHSLFKFFERGY